MNQRVANVLLVVAVTCAVIMSAAVVRREFFLNRAVSNSSTVRNWSEIARGQHVRGAQDAKTIVVEFFDFQCPACRRLSHTLDTLLNTSPSEFQLVRRHFPLSNIHEHAYQLAVAGVCVAEQGAFDEYYTTVFRRQKEIGQAGWKGVMSLLPVGVDSSIVRRCLNQGTASAVVDSDIAAGESVPLSGTPTLIINGRVHRGSKSVLALDSIIKHAGRGE